MISFVVLNPDIVRETFREEVENGGWEARANLFLAKYWKNLLAIVVSIAMTAFFYMSMVSYLDMSGANWL